MDEGNQASRLPPHHEPTPPLSPISGKSRSNTVDTLDMSLSDPLSFENETDASESNRHAHALSCRCSDCVNDEAHQEEVQRRRREGQQHRQHDAEQHNQGRGPTRLQTSQPVPEPVAPASEQAHSSATMEFLRTPAGQSLAAMLANRSNKFGNVMATDDSRAVFGSIYKDPVHLIFMPRNEFSSISQQGRSLALYGTQHVSALESNAFERAPQQATQDERPEDEWMKYA